MAINLSPKTPKKYCCEICDYNTYNKKDYTIHLSTDNHKKGILANNTNDNVPKTPNNEKSLINII